MILRDLQKFEESLVQYDQALKSSRFCSSGFVGKGLALSQI